MIRKKKLRLKQQFAFTLIELLVVIAIIALLLSMIAPALTKAKRQALKIICSNNEKQIGLSLLLYGDENDGKLPLNYANGWLWDIAYSTTDFIIETGGDKRTFYCPLEKTKNSDLAIFYNYTQAVTLVPPSDTDRLADTIDEPETGRENYYRVTGYFWLMDTEAGRDDIPIIGDKSHLWPKTTIEKNPAAAELVTDAILSMDSNARNTTFTEVIGGSWYTWGIYDRTNHVDRTQMPEDTDILFLDGHVSRRRFNDVEVYFGWPPYFWW